MSRQAGLGLLLALLGTRGVSFGQSAQAVPDMPPEVRAVIDRARSGQPPSEAEKKALEEWGRSLGAAKSPAASPASPGAGSAAASEAPKKKGGAAAALKAELSRKMLCPAPPKVAIALPTKPPERDAYRTLVQGWVNAYGAKLGPARGKISEAVRSADRARDGSDLGALLLALGAGSAGTYAIAESALRDPDNPVTANNLGVALQGMKDLRAAMLVLLYADKLLPDSPSVVVNMAWVHLDAGNTGLARQAFERAAKLDPALPGAHQGLGLLDYCVGDNRAAASHLRQSLDGTFSSVAAAALQAADQAAAAAGDPQNGARPIRVDSGKSSGNTGKKPRPKLELAEPLITPDIAQTRSRAKELQALYLDSFQQEREAVQALLDQRDAYQKARHREGFRQAVFTGGAVELYRRYEYEVFLLSDLERIFIKEKEKPALQDFLTRGSQMSLDLLDPLRTLGLEEAQASSACRSDDRCRQSVKSRFCHERNGVLQDFHARFYGTWAQYWSVAGPTLHDYYDFAGTSLARIDNAVVNRYHNEMRKAAVLHDYNAALVVLMQEGGMVQVWDPACAPPPAKPPVKLGSIQIWRNEGECVMGHGRIGLGVASVHWDCDEIEAVIGEGLVGGIALDWSGGSLTAKPFVGVGFQEKLGPINVEGRAGLVLEIGHGGLLDYGVKAALQATAGGEETKLGGLGAGAKITGQLMLEAGPEVSPEVFVNFGLVR